MGFVVCIICIIVSVYLIYLSSIKAFEISKMDDDRQEEEELKNIRMFSYVAIAGIFIGIISLLFFKGVIQVAIPAVIIFIVSTGINRILIEEEKKENVKNDYEILEDFLKEAEKDAKEKSKK